MQNDDDLKTEDQTDEDLQGEPEEQPLDPEPSVYTPRGGLSLGIRLGF